MLGISNSASRMFSNTENFDNALSHVATGKIKGKLSSRTNRSNFLLFDLCENEVKYPLY